MDTTSLFYEKLKGLIVNLPQTGVTQLDIQLKAGQPVPLVVVKLWPTGTAPALSSPPDEERLFVLVEERKWRVIQLSQPADYEMEIDIQ